VATIALEVIWVTFADLAPFTAVNLGVLLAFGEALLDSRAKLADDFAKLAEDFAKLAEDFDCALVDFVWVAGDFVFVTVTFGVLEPVDFDFKAFPLQWDGWLLTTVANAQSLPFSKPCFCRNHPWS
jgi:hypothetical protein